MGMRPAGTRAPSHGYERRTGHGDRHVASLTEMDGSPEVRGSWAWPGPTR
jgi:hypothetical protein